MAVPPGKRWFHVYSDGREGVIFATHDALFGVFVTGRPGGPEPSPLEWATSLSAAMVTADELAGARSVPRNWRNE